MRRRTKLASLAILAVVVLLLALGALPSFIKAGDPHYMTATPVEEQAAVNASDLDERRYPYTTAAIDDATAEEPGHSSPYWKGYVGFKEAFTHSPFDELTALQQRSTAAVDGPGAVFVRVEDAHYRLTVER
ncbi:hypothetical protein HLRTI_000371 [Halorhabdus tiamatea SARL4B]|uniref:Uncharacterized protein n=1 Tax=Halorhabdus tiamatea SARL4B TaxID=1033806 RepID=F7PK84_9EURY|nr:hypothetical protein [Halorhabdus tiamatea]ERJ07618.1 hypothetical protein HLRTI_000371 [Halorhabdus tiamatea SARL4B]CCQ33431.1 conserved hypothetical protein [Halorhabdus tiamatea SARL4B]